MKYVTKPFEIEAVRFDGTNFGELIDFVGKREAKDTPGFFINNFAEVEQYWPEHEPDVVAVVYDYIQQTWVGVHSGDYIIKGMMGEFYPCNPQVFNSKYAPKGNSAGCITSEQMALKAIQQGSRFR